MRQWSISGRRRIPQLSRVCGHQQLIDCKVMSLVWATIVLLATTSSCRAFFASRMGRRADGARRYFIRHYASIADELESPFHNVHWLDEQPDDDMEGISLGDCIGQGEVVVCIRDVASEEECRALFGAGLKASKGRGPAARGRSRFSVSDPSAFTNQVVLQCDEILLRVLDHIDENIPSIYETLFKPSENWATRQPLNAQLEQPTVPPDEYLADMCDSLRELYMMGQLEWSEGEPAINVYEADGHFGAHKDHLALTVLIPLTSPMEDFSGGGTGFWSGNRLVGENPQEPPDRVLTPRCGSALIFGGDVTHAGMPVVDGYRSVFVCSFSTRTPASPEDRLHGMQAPPQVSPNFKGTI